MDLALKTKVAAWRDKVGYTRAREKLLELGMSLSVVQKILAGTYKPQPKIDKIEMIKKAIRSKP